MRNRKPQRIQRGRHTVKTEYRQWTIDAVPIVIGDDFRACAIITRRPIGVDAIGADAVGARLTFSSLGDFGSETAAQNHATTWAKRWIDENM